MVRHNKPQAHADGPSRELRSNRKAPRDGTPFMGTADSGCVAQGVASLRRRNKEVPTAIGRQSPWGFGDAASSRVKCANVVAGQSLD